MTERQELEISKGLDRAAININITMFQRQGRQNSPRSKSRLLMVEGKQELPSDEEDDTMRG